MTGKIVLALTMLVLLAILSACGRAEAPAPVRSHQWQMHPMSGGPTLYSACVNGVRIFALQPLASRASHGLWPGASIAAVREGGCERLG